MTQSNDVTIGVLGDGPGVAGWVRVLEQEGLPFEVPAGPNRPIVVSGGAVPEWFDSYVRGGGMFVLSGAPPLDVLGPSVLATIQRIHPAHAGDPVATPCLARLFRGDGDGVVRLHEDRITKSGIEQGVFPLVASHGIGRGHVIYTGVPLTMLLEAGGDHLRRFAPFSPVTERVASVDKAGVVDVLVAMLRKAFNKRGMPYVRLQRFPHGSPSVLVLRVDVDGIFGDRAARLAGAAAAAGLRASFFLNGSKCEDDPGEVRNWPGDHEIGHHGFVHNLFDTVQENLDNLRRGAAWVRESAGTEPSTFVAPRGMWNDALDQALAVAGYPYSSDFGLDFDSLPFRTPAGVLQVPVHPYSPERARVYASEQSIAPPTAEEICDHYLRVLERQAKAGRPVHVYGHPEVLGAHAEVVVPALAEAAAGGGIPNLTLREYAQWWALREKANMRLLWDPDARIMGVRFDDEGEWDVDVFDRHLGDVEQADSAKQPAAGAVEEN